MGHPYKNTRHNVGFLVVDALAQRLLATWTVKSKFHAEIAEGKQESAKVILAKPTTLMNRSGQAVEALVSFYKPEMLLVVHDEADLTFGDIRVKTGGGSAGHNGLNSIVEHLGPDFTRVRVGIGHSPNPKISLEDWVLGKWSEEEQAKLDGVVQGALDTILSHIAPPP